MLWRVEDGGGCDETGDGGFEEGDEADDDSEEVSGRDEKCDRARDCDFRFLVWTVFISEHYCIKRGVGFPFWGARM